VIGSKDANNCLRVESIQSEAQNVEVPSDATQQPKCVNGFAGDATCDAPYDPAAVARPDTVDGCEFDENSAQSATVEGFLVDGLCYNNFIVEQKDFNGAPGLAPDGVHLRTSMPFHTRACLLVKYCAKTGFYLVDKGSDDTYGLVARFEIGENGGEKVFDYVKSARPATSSEDNFASAGQKAGPASSMSILMTFAAVVMRAGLWS